MRLLLDSHAFLWWVNGDRALPAKAGFKLLPLALQHIAAVEHLPFHHRDPFDRLLVVQAKIETMTLVTRDRALKAYDVDVI